MKNQNFSNPSDLSITWKPLHVLQPYHGNARQHSEKQVSQIAESIQTFGFNNPVLLDEHNGIIAGHGRLEAARLLKLQTIPTICLFHMSEAQKRAYIIADNKLAENASWDTGLLKIELNYLAEIDPAFDLGILGFEPPEIDYILQVGDEVDNEQDIIPFRSGALVTKPGDIWILGEHRIFCGDSLVESSFDALMQDEKADLVFTDPPYNVPVQGHICGNGKIKHAEFAMASGEMSAEEFTQFLTKIFERLIHYSKDGSVHYICMDWRHLPEITRAGLIYTELKNLCVWNKNNGGMGSLYRSKHELVFVYKSGKKAHTNNIELGKHGRHRTNVWDYAGVNGLHSQDDLAMHPTVKPVALIQDAILDCSCRNQIILDVFGGSGSTLIAAENCSRKARLIEIDPCYVDTTIERWQKHTGQQAVLTKRGKAYDELKREGGDE